MSIKRGDGRYYTPRLTFRCRSPYGERSDEEQLKRKQELIDTHTCTLCMNIFLDWLLDKVEKHGPEIGPRVAESIAQTKLYSKNPKSDHFAEKIRFISEM